MTILIIDIEKTRTDDDRNLASVFKASFKRFPWPHPLIDSKTLILKISAVNKFLDS